MAESQNNLAKKLGYAGYDDMVSKSGNPNIGTIVTDNGYLRTNLIDTDALFAKDIKLKQEGSISNADYVTVRDDAEKVVNMDYHCLTIYRNAVTEDVEFDTFSEARTYYNSHDVSAYGIKVTTDKGNTYYIDSFFNSGSIVIQNILYAYFDEDDESDIVAYDSFGLQDLDFVTYKYVNFENAGTQWLNRSRDIILHDVNKSGFIIRADGHAEFNNAVVRGEINANSGNLNFVRIGNEAIFEGEIHSGPLDLESKTPVPKTYSYTAGDFVPHFDLINGTGTYGNISFNKYEYRTQNSNTHSWQISYYYKDSTLVLTEKTDAMNQGSLRLSYNFTYTLNTKSTDKTFKLNGIPTTLPSEHGIVWNDGGTLKLS